MADHDKELAHMTQPQPHQDEWTGSRSSHYQIPRDQIPRDPQEPRDHEPRREGHSQQENPQGGNQDSRQDDVVGGNVGAPFNPLRITWQQTQEG